MNVIASKFQVLTAVDQREFSLWDEFVDRAPVPDVYYRPGYALANEVTDRGKAIALLLTTDNAQALIPLLLRPLSDLPFAVDQSGFDAMTPYGYGGLLVLAGREGLSQSDLRGLLTGLRHWCNERDVVSCHLRLHPLLEQTRCMNANGFLGHTTRLCFRGSTTAIDLSKWDSTNQRITGMTASRRWRLNRARRHLRVSWGGSEISMPEALTLFRQIYEYRMARVHASPYYYFSEQYYTTLAERTNLGVALAWDGNELVGGQLFLADRQFAHFHLSGANENGLKLGSPTLLLNEGAQWARERGCTLIHLGGGAEGVFEYKRSFGGPVYRYYTLDIIADESRYRDLVERRLDYEPVSQLREDFFPRYRA
jgi:Acetyltransferase (GNAT) domain